MPAAWATSSTLAGLAGVLLAPRYATVSIDNYTVLLVAAIAGAAIAGLESPVIAAVASVGIGVAMGLTTGYAPAGSVWSTGLLSAIPFVLLLGLLAFHPKLRRLGSSEDPLASVDPPPTPILPPERSVMLTSSLRYIGPAVLVLMVISMLTWVSSTWVFVITGGLGLSLVFMSITLTTGAAVLDDALVSFDCRVTQALEVGTHTVFICEVDAVKSNQDRGLLYFARSYHTIG